ncbi:MAG: L-fuculose-phosphate aldolase [Velocimicrobium sp.]
MLMERERQEIVEYGKKMLTSGLTKGTAGNISVYDPETGYMAISPSGVGYLDTKTEDIVIMDLNGNIIEGDRKPSSEHDLHTIVYKKKPYAKSVVHTHSMFCSTLSCLNTPLEAVHYVLADAGVPRVPVVSYRTYGTKELAEIVGEQMGKSDAALLANHGMLACGASLQSAYGLASTCEWVAELQWRCMCVGKPSVLPDEEVKVVMEHFKSYGQNECEGEAPAHSYNG